jgi:hypothetical protein
MQRYRHLVPKHNTYKACKDWPLELKRNTFAKTLNSMKKGTRYLLAILACIVILFVYVVFQETIARGMLVAVLFVFAMRFVWKKIVGPKKEEDGETQK